MIEFYENPDDNPLKTKSGKLEYYAQWLYDNFPDDKERGPVPHWVIGGSEEDGWCQNESLEGDRAKQYPLPLESNHPRWRLHAQCDDITWLREIPTCKIKGYDGYMYEPVWLHPNTAAERGIEHGDIVKIYNERGIVLGAAYVTERMIPGAAYQDHGSRIDPIAMGPDDWIDRAGANNLICPKNIISKNATGMVCSGFLVEVEKLNPVEMEDWRKKYPEAFSRPYDPASGPLFFDAWVEGGK
jgi:trimethylamine-N-oxide reductase (cytochrome c)